MEKILTEIKEGKYRHSAPVRKNILNITSYLPEIPKKSPEERKRGWYKIGKVLWRGHKLQLHKESQVGARRTYEYYSLRKGDWSDLSCRQFSKMSRFKYKVELTMRSREFSEENSSLNEGNLEESQLTLGSSDTKDLGKIFSTGLGMNEELGLMPIADPPMPTAALPMPNAKGRTPNAESRTPNAESRMPFADSFSQLD